MVTLTYALLLIVTDKLIEKADIVSLNKCVKINNEIRNYCKDHNIIKKIYENVKREYDYFFYLYDSKTCKKVINFLSMFQDIYNTEYQVYIKVTSIKENLFSIVLNSSIGTHGINLNTDKYCLHGHDHHIFVFKEFYDYILNVYKCKNYIYLKCK